MIDHVSIPVSDLKTSAAFYEALLATIGHHKLVERPETVGFGKQYPEFWLNLRPALTAAGINDGFHVCLRAKSADVVDRFHAVALQHGGRCDGAPGLRPHYAGNYYAAFIRDADSNRIELVTFT
ncbi:MAG TPA: VOC family protein [Dongiaceae bacterium]|nr:VOC family protein [Dongiaceae bacterium]